jgi:hypothetical protein
MWRTDEVEYLRQMVCDLEEEVLRLQNDISYAQTEAWFLKMQYEESLKLLKKQIKEVV